MQWTFDMENLDYNINKYEIINNIRAYLIMNQDTADSFASQSNIPYASKNQIYMYKGNKILIDNDLKLGEVEIR